MIRERLARYRDRVRGKLTTAFREEHTPHEIGLSFAIGILVTALPSGGLGVGLLAGLAAWKSWISKAAVVAAIAVLNPVIKPAVYVASYQLGGVALGTGSLRPDETTAALAEGSLTEVAGAAIRQLLVGNVLIAVVLSISSYAVVTRLTRAHRERVEERTDRSTASAVLGLFRRF
ncbi:DUF2062 domain-containing protein [Natronococcus occultus]|uniref:DUF2062 domain-containing protein n=1 Tax=Natronococcus occultus SP4 TaxID=694430 RepID=L0JUW9_9EURY|nr:DUF2062 domain-containing protein [Natronococcus occultus]AGB36792.1 hypothetical protein Natoc_0944 [Natronococcus occultus SP4]